MPQDPAGILIGGTGQLFVAPAGTEMPAAWDDELHEDFVELGFTTKDGFKFSDGKEVRDSEVWQRFYAPRKSVTSRSVRGEFGLKEWNDTTLAFAFGGTVTVAGSGGRLSPPSPEDLDERALVARVVDGEKISLWCFPEGIVEGAVESEFKRDDDSLLPIVFGGIGTDDEDPWYMLANFLTGES